MFSVKNGNADRIKISGIPLLYNSQQQNLFQYPFLKMNHQTLSSAGQFEASIVSSIGKGVFVDCTFPVILFLSCQGRAVILSASPHFTCDSVQYNIKVQKNQSSSPACKICSSSW